MSKKKKSIEALRKSHDEQMKRIQDQLEFQKKLFPNGVLKRGDGELHILDVDMKQISLDLALSMNNDFAQRLQDIQDSKQKNQADSVAERKKATKKKIQALLKKHKIVITNNTKAGQIVNILTEKGVKKIPDVKTFREFLKQK